MGKVIKIDDDVYNALRELQAPRETYSEVVARLVDISRALNGLEPILRGSVTYHEWRQQQTADAAAAQGR